MNDKEKRFFESLFPNQKNESKRNKNVQSWIRK